MMDEVAFDSLVKEIGDFVAEHCDTAGAHRLIEAIAATIRSHRPSPSLSTMFVALAGVARSLIPECDLEPVWLAAFSRAVADTKIKRHPDGAPMLHGEPPVVLQ